MSSLLNDVADAAGCQIDRLHEYFSAQRSGEFAAKRDVSVGVGLDDLGEPWEERRLQVKRDTLAGRIWIDKRSGLRADHDRDFAVWGRAGDVELHRSGAIAVKRCQQVNGFGTHIVPSDGVVRAVAAAGEESETGGCRFSVRSTFHVPIGQRHAVTHPGVKISDPGVHDAVGRKIKDRAESIPVIDIEIVPGGSG